MMMIRAHPLLVLVLPSALPDLLRGAASVESHSLLQSKAVVEVVPQPNSTGDPMLQVFQKMVSDVQEYVAGSSVRIEKLIIDSAFDVQGAGDRLFQKLGQCRGRKWSGRVGQFQQKLRDSADNAKDLRFHRMTSWMMVQTQLSQVVRQKKADLRIAAFGVANVTTTVATFAEAMQRTGRNTRALLKRANASCHETLRQVEASMVKRHQDILNNSTGDNSTKRRHYPACLKVADAEFARSQAYIAVIRTSCACDVQMLVEGATRLESISSLAYNGTDLPMEPIPRLDTFFKLVAQAGADLMDKGASCMAVFDDGATECLDKVVPDEFEKDVVDTEPEKEEEEGDHEESEEEKRNEEDALEEEELELQLKKAHKEKH